MISLKYLPREEAAQTALYLLPPVDQELPSVSLTCSFSTVSTCTKRATHYKGAFWLAYSVWRVWTKHASLVLRFAAVYGTINSIRNRITKSHGVWVLQWFPRHQTTRWRHKNNWEDIFKELIFKYKKYWLSLLRRWFVFFRSVFVVCSL